jgi:hypothetical protein
MERIIKKKTHENKTFYMLTGIFGSEQENEIFINLIYFSRFVVIEKDFNRRKDDL